MTISKNICILCNSQRISIYNNILSSYKSIKKSNLREMSKGHKQANYESMLIQRISMLIRCMLIQLIIQKYAQPNYIKGILIIKIYFLPIRL